MYVGFVDLEKSYVRLKEKHYIADTENAWWGQQSIKLKSMYVNSLAFGIVKGGDASHFELIAIQ